MSTLVLKPIMTRHDRSNFPTPQAVAKHFGMPIEAVEAHTTRIDGIESDILFVSWRVGTVFPDSIKVFVHQ